jgi:hypothetical protein
MDQYGGIGRIFVLAIEKRGCRSSLPDDFGPTAFPGGLDQVVGHLNVASDSLGVRTRLMRSLDQFLSDLPIQARQTDVETCLE